MPRDDAIPLLVELEGPRLLDLAQRICSSAHEAEDLVQEVFMRAWRAWPDFEGRSTVRTWLYRIAANTSETLRRRRSGEPAGFESIERLVLSEELGASSPSVPEMAMRGELREIVGTVIFDLDESFRLPLVLKEIVGLKLSRIADVLGVELATIKTRLHRARAKLRDVLDGVLPEKRLTARGYGRLLALDVLRACTIAGQRGAGFDTSVLIKHCAAPLAALDPPIDVAAALASAVPATELRERLLAAASSAVHSDADQPADLTK